MSNFQVQKAYLVQKRQKLKPINIKNQKKTIIIQESQKHSFLDKTQLPYLFEKNKLFDTLNSKVDLQSLSQINIQFNSPNQALKVQQNKTFSGFNSEKSLLEGNDFNPKSSMVIQLQRKSHSSFKKFNFSTNYLFKQKKQIEIKNNIQLQDYSVYQEKRYIPYITITESLQNMKSNSLYLTYRDKKPTKNKLFVINFWDLLGKRGYVSDSFFSVKESNHKKPYKIHKNIIQLIQEISQEFSVVILIDKDAYTKQIVPILLDLQIDAIYINYQNIHYFFDFSQILTNFKGVDDVVYMTSIMCELQDGQMRHTNNCLYNRLPFVKENIKVLIVLIPNSMFIQKDPFEFLPSIINKYSDHLNKDLKSINNIYSLFQKDIQCLCKQDQQKQILQIIQDLKEDNNSRQIKEISQTNAHLNIYNEFKNVGQTKHPTFFCFIGELFVKNCKFPLIYDKIQIKLIESLHAIANNSNTKCTDYSKNIEYFQCIKNNIFTLQDL